VSDEQTKTMREDGDGVRGGAPGVIVRLAWPPSLAGRELGVPLRSGLTLGRGSAEGLEQPTLSRAHAELKRRGMGLRVKDLGSRNGTFVDGAPVTEERVAMPGSVVRFGDVLAVVESTEVEGSNLGAELLPGGSTRMRVLRKTVARIARGVAPVLLLGETGTGKEYVARAVHEIAAREGEYVPFNCAGLTPTLADSQLFGHRKGAFTGATEAREGLFRAAHRGTLFLDEVAELDPAVQGKLRRALEERRITPLGAAAPVEVDVRVVAATHPALAERVAEGRFRRDLYARLAIAELRIPAVRERRADVPTWLRRLDDRWCAREGGRPLEWSALALERAMMAPWPENLRGLDRLVYGLRVRLGSGATVALADLDALLASQRVAEPAKPAKTGRPPKPTAEELRRVLEANDGSVRATAKHFQRARKQIYRWMSAYGLRGEDE